MVSVIEATLEKPRQVLSAQEKKARGEAIAAMKAEGMEYNDRMAALEEVTYPQPLAEVLGNAFEQYRAGAPWLGDFELAPKSVVRDMYERAMSFSEYVQFYSLARSEGVLLRYLTDAFKALRQTVPQDALREDLEDLIEWLGELIRQIDSSLLDEWEELANGVLHEPDAEIIPPAPERLTSNERAFRVMVRNEMFRRVKLFADEQDARAGRAGRAQRLRRRCLGRCHGRVLRGARGHRRRPRRPRPQPAADHRRPRSPGRCGRSSPTRPTTTTGASTPTVNLADSDEAGYPVITVTNVGRLD